MSTICQVTAKDFATQVVDSTVPALIDFYADWCAPCRMLAPVLEKLADEYQGRVNILKVNVESQPALASHFRVQSIPTLIAFQNGQPVDRLTGIGSPGQLRQLLDRLAGNSLQTPAGTR